MYINRRFVQYFIGLLFLVSVISPGQEAYFVANTDSPEATAYNNSHKIALQNGDGPNDTIYVAFHSSDSVFCIFTSDQGQSWSTPMFVSHGKYPALDISEAGFHYLAWQKFDTTHSTYEVYYDCLDDWSPPLNVSQSITNSILPDLVIDNSNIAHIVWVEDISGHNQIYYRTIENNLLGDTLRISDYGTNQAVYNHPSISIMYPDNRIYVIWECYDSLCYSPYQIHQRYREGNIWDSTSVQAHYLPIRHPSLDHSHGWDTLSYCYEDSTSGNLEATFCGGNGGGYSTQGRSSYPVVSTVGFTWSYLFWQEDLTGYQDIYYDLYYEFSGWTNGSLRATFNIQESVRFPSVCGAYLVWTQGDSLPYSIYFADFGYPIGVRESGQSPMTTITATPNPFNKLTRLTLTNPTTKPGTRLRVYDSSGRLVKTLHVGSGMSGIGLPGGDQKSSVVWGGDDIEGNELPAGIYWCCLIDINQKVVMKVIKVD